MLTIDPPPDRSIRRTAIAAPYIGPSCSTRSPSWMCWAETSWAGLDQSIPALFTQWRSVPSRSASSAARSWSSHSPTSPASGWNEPPSSARRAFERSLVTVDADHRDRVGQQPLRDRAPDAHRRPRDDGDGGPGGPGPLSLLIRHSGGISAYARSMSTPWLLRTALATK